MKMTDSLSRPKLPGEVLLEEEEEEENAADVRKRLFESLNSRRRLTVDTGGLQRLLTFVEQPSFFREPAKVSTRTCTCVFNFVFCVLRLGSEGHGMSTCTQKSPFGCYQE